jgi:ABC-type transporter Mla MlaB component
MRTRTSHNPFMIRVVTDGAATTVAPTRKRLMISDMESVYSTVSRQMDLGRTQIILDFSEVEWVCAGTAAVLLELNRRLHALGGALKLQGVCDEMHQVLQMMHVEDRFDILDVPVVLRNAG